MRFVLWAFLLLCPFTVGLGCWTFLFPLWRSCVFPTKNNFPLPSFQERLLNFVSGNRDSQNSAEFRLLAFGDPQLEGDSSIWRADRNALYRPKNLRRELKKKKNLKAQLGVLVAAVEELVKRALPSQFKAWRKQLDLLGNDYYLAHIYRSLHRATNPTHVTVLGDLLGSQWINDAEFEWRAWRYWNRVFKNSVVVNSTITSEQTREVLGENSEWARRIINVAGNHDIGYAGDITPHRVDRFERAFGSVNWDVLFEHSQTHERSGSHPTLRIIVLNSMNLDTPAKSADLQMKTYDFVNEAITRSAPVEDRTTGTILLTHIPLHKEAGVCTDAPFFDFHGPWDGGGVKEQNHLSYSASSGVVLQGLYGMSDHPEASVGGRGRVGIVLNGHDHEGCDTYHFLPEVEEENDGQARTWNATRFENAGELTGGATPGIREVTLRAMMGEYGGFAYMISSWFDFDVGEWKFSVNRCSAGVQHWWWATHVLVLVNLGLGGVAVTLEIFSPTRSVDKEPSSRQEGNRKTKGKGGKRIK